MHIAFDIGNVLLHYELPIFREAMIERRLCFYDDEVDLFITEAEHLCYIGATTLEKRLISKFPYLRDNDKNELIQIWNKTIYPNKQMINFMHELKHDGIKIALLSNIGLEHAEYIKNTWPEIFDMSVCHLSHEVGAFKPTKLFYQSFLLEHEEFSGCIYLDDIKENVIAGSKFKFNAIEFNLDKISKEKPSVLKNKLKEIKEKILFGS